MLEKLRAWWDGLYREENRSGYDWREESKRMVSKSTRPERAYQIEKWKTAKYSDLPLRYEEASKAMLRISLAMRPLTDDITGYFERMEDELASNNNSR